MSSYNDPCIKHNDWNQTREYFKRGQRPPYFTAILDNHDIRGYDEKGRSENETADKNRSTDETETLHGLKKGSIGTESDTTGGELKVDNL